MIIDIKRQDKVVAALEDILVEVRKGNVVSFAVSAVFDNGTILNHWQKNTQANSTSLLGAINLLLHGIIESHVKEERENPL